MSGPIAWLQPALVFAAEQPVGKVIALTGTVEFRSAAGPVPLAGKGGAKVKPVSFSPWEKVKLKQPMYARDEFRTARLSRVKILFADKSLIALGPNSKMQVQSYMHNSHDKLRQGVIGIAHGLSMYIVNKSQKNKKSFFKIVTPTGNLAARGTHGYISATPDVTFVANQAGAMMTSSSDPSVRGRQVVGRMMKTSIARGRPPVPPTRLARGDIKMIRNVVLGRVGAGSRARVGGKALIEEQEPEKKKKEEKKKSEKKTKSQDKRETGKQGKKTDKKSGTKESKKDSAKSAEAKGSGDSGKTSDTTDSNTGDTAGGSDPAAADASDTQADATGASDAADGAGATLNPADAAGASAPSDVGGASTAQVSAPAADSGFGGDLAGGGGFAESFTQAAGVGPDFGGPADFAEVNQPFDAAAASSCAP